MKTFNVYLNNKLTVIDVFLQQLFQWFHHNRIIINATVERMSIRKALYPSEIKANMLTYALKLLKKSYDSANGKVVLSANGVSSSSKYVSSDINVLLGLGELLSIVLRYPSQGKSDMFIGAYSDGYKLNKYLDTCESVMSIATSALDSFKSSYLAFEPKLYLSAIGETSAVKTVDESHSIGIDLSVISGDYMSESDITLAKNVMFNANIGISAYLTGEIALKRLRRLLDMDDETLEVFDSMTMGELKYLESV